MLKNRFARSVMLATALVVLSATADPLRADEGQQLRSLVDGLREQIERAERERLADPWFIQELRALLQQYDWPWQVPVYERDFVAEGLREVPAPWQVASGHVGMDWNRGLRSTATPPPGADQRPPSGEELVGALVGTILDQALRGGQRQDAPASAAGPARYRLPVGIDNAFALRVNLTQRPPEGAPGRYAFTVYQGTPEGGGYRLDMTAGTDDGEVAFALVRQSSRGTSQTVEFYDGERRLRADRSQELLWTRDRSGKMVVSLDGESLFSVDDRGFRDPWDGLAVINAGGDLAISRIEIEAAP